MKLRWTDWLAIGLLALVLWGDRIDLSRFWPEATPTLPAPSAELQAVVTPIASLVAGETADADRAALSEYYAAFADVVSRDGKTRIIATTGLLRTANERAGQLMFQQTGLQGRYAGIVDAIARAWGNHLGIAATKDGATTYRVVDLDDAKRAKAVEFYAALAWAFEQPLPNTEG